MRSVGDGGLMGPMEEKMVSNKANKDGGLWENHVLRS